MALGRGWWAAVLVAIDQHQHAVSTNSALSSRDSSASTSHTHSGLSAEEARDMKTSESTRRSRGDGIPKTYFYLTEQPFGTHGTQQYATQQSMNSDATSHRSHYVAHVTSPQTIPFRPNS
ncbi:hypothetical protein AC579_3065 [Pseudocercospora musae]|uniref:Uncharacterized protein n=1 Tax=Pseudocercospora musae TaxID=113226 RepID=A0A139IJV6_9PEZI|nr:hypothetical protein AC579_3065 [Pseudocercospora musae]